MRLLAPKSIIQDVVWMVTYRIDVGNHDSTSIVWLLFFLFYELEEPIELVICSGVISSGGALSLSSNC